MCGIAGTINANGVKEEDVRRMIGKIQHRGKDESGVESKSSSVMGHVRLAVVDPENGFQPMSNTDDTVWVIFNGEIYNFVEIREDLKAKGYQFKSRCDTEVLVHLWREKGEKLLDDLIGMYAFFIWDEKEQRGMLARDRFGIKPCFYSKYKDGYAFCSEIKGLLELPDFPKEVNRNALSQVMAFNYCPPPETCFEGINHLEPGTYLMFEPGKEPVQKRYWQWPYHEERRTPSFEEWEALMTDAVRMQMRFDVEGGLFLSGGIDSSVVGSYLVKQWNRDKLEAVGLDFHEKEYSEYHYSELAAQTLGISVKPSLINWSDIPEIAEKVSWQTEQPHGDFSFFLFWILSQKAHQEGKIVMFTGDGPDETLFGFNHNVEFFNENTRTNFPLKSYFERICYMNAETRQRVFGDRITNAVDPLDRFESLVRPWRDLDPIEQVIAYETTSLMPGNNFVKSDRMGAFWSIEGRSPFLDHRVMELFTRLPIKEKVNMGVGKKFLKKQAEQHFSHEFLYSKKRMPTTPIGEWMKDLLYGWTREVISSRHHDLYDQQEALKILESHKSGAQNHTRELRTLLMTSLWAKNYFN